MSQSQVAQAVGRDEKVFRRFLEEKSLESGQGKGSRFGHVVNVDKKKGYGHSTPITTQSIDLASEFWLEQSFKGNKKAQGLAFACIQESLKRRCDIGINQLS